jgi:hypothetical protein
LIFALDTLDLCLTLLQAAAAGAKTKMQFLFAEHTLDIDRCELLRGSAPIAVEPQVFDLLIYRLQNRHLIRTVARKRVRFIGEVRVLADGGSPAHATELPAASRMQASRRSLPLLPIQSLPTEHRFEREYQHRERQSAPRYQADQREEPAGLVVGPAPSRPEARAWPRGPRRPVRRLAASSQPGEASRAVRTSAFPYEAKLAAKARKARVSQLCCRC